MSHRNSVLVAIAMIFLVAIVGLKLAWFVSSPLLTVHLRCNDPTTGRLSIAILSETGTSRDETSFDVKTACGVGKIEMEHYRIEESLRIEIDRGGGHTSTLIAQYGSNIQRDQEGFFTVLKITNTPPFLANDSI